VNSLQQEILRAHSAVSRGERGAERELKRLQAEYRTSGHLIERPGGTARLIESPAAATVTAHPLSQEVTPRHRRSRDTQPQKPYWQLGNEGRESWRWR
jgi:hypothetical protein